MVSAILLVGGSAYAHLTTALIPRARTIDGIRSHVVWLHTFIKASGPMAGLVLITGLYLTFAGSWWRAGWPAVSLVLFAVGGAAATGIIDPKVARVRATLDELPDGPVTPEVAGRLSDRTLTLVSHVLVGADLAIVYLMTNKPTLLPSIGVGVIGLGLGTILGIRANGNAATAAVGSATPPEPAH